MFSVYLDIALGVAILAVCLYLLRKIRRLYLRVEAVRERVDRLASQDLIQLHQQLVAHLRLGTRLGIDTLPPTRGWAASPDVLSILAETVELRRPQRVLELGSGVSSIVLAKAMSLVGRGRLYSVDHDAGFLAQTREAIDRHGLSDRVTLIDAPLVERAGRRWYDAARIPAGPFGLIFVDGPSMADERSTRRPAGPLLLPRLAPGGCMIIDDAKRPEEREAVESWRAEFPDYRFEAVPAEKGCVLIWRDDATSVASRAASS